MHVPGPPQPAGNKPYSLVRAIGWGIVLMVPGQAQGTCAERKNHPSLSGLEAPGHSHKNILFQGLPPHAMHAPGAQQPAGNKPYSLVRAIGWGVVLMILALLSNVIAVHINGLVLLLRGKASDEQLQCEASKILLFACVVQTICTCTAVWLVVRYRRPAPVSDYFPFRSVSWKIIVSSMVCSSILAILKPTVIWAISSAPFAIQDKKIPAASWQATLSMVFLAPFYEEVLFRGLLFKDLQRSWVGPRGAVLISAAVFTCFHIDGFSLSALPKLGVIFCLGLLASWARYKTGSLWSAVAMHVAWNGIITILCKMHIEQQNEIVAILKKFLNGVQKNVADYRKKA